MKNFHLFINKISKEERNVSVQYSSMTFAEIFNVLIFEIMQENSYES